MAAVLCVGLVAVAGPVRARAAWLNVVPNITIEIPDSGGTQFTLTNICDKYTDEFDLYFGYAPGATLTCNKEIQLFEIIWPGEVGDEYLYFVAGADFPSYYDNYKMLQDFPAGTPLDLSALYKTDGSYDQGIPVLVFEPNEGVYADYSDIKGLNFYPMEAFLGFGSNEDFEFYPISDLAVPTPSSPLDGAADYAKPELQLALDLGLVPDSAAKAGWTNATSRLAAAEAMVTLIEKASGETMAQIAAERGWDLSKNGFSDTDSQYVTFLKYAEVTNGMGNDLYAPASDYTRAQMVTMIGRAAEAFFGKTAKGNNPFTDVPDWAAPYVGYAASTGITNGVGGGKFDPDGVLQNQQTGLFEYRAYEAWK